MKKAWYFVANTVLYLFISIAALPAAAQNSNNPVGRWQTLFPGSGFPEFIMVVNENGGVLTGTIVEVFAKPGRTASTVCERCTGELKNQPLVGMVILKNATFDKKSNTWVGGTYINPNTGVTYSATVWTSNQSQALRIRAGSPGGALSHNYRWQRVG